MLAPDIISLRQFYASPLGQRARGFIEAEMRHVWPSAKGEELLAIGYATPYLEGYLQQGAQICVCMPARQGAAFWPVSGNNRVLLAHESELPLPENSMNRVLLIHSVENSEQLSWMIEEVWRVLTPGGRMLAVVPNRHGFWARGAHTPFGYGRPFSLAQMRDLLSEHQFTITRSRPALFIPPTGIQWLWKLASHIEAIGHFFCPFFGGVWLVEAEKQVYASIKQSAQRKRYGAIIPAAQPAMTRS